MLFTKEKRTTADQIYDMRILQQQHRERKRKRSPVHTSGISGKVDATRSSAILFAMRHPVITHDARRSAKETRDIAQKRAALETLMKEELKEEMQKDGRPNAQVDAGKLDDFCTQKVTEFVGGSNWLSLVQDRELVNPGAVATKWNAYKEELSNAPMPEEKKRRRAKLG